jgi:endonuclease YncB( thermonuclease family)
MPAWAGCRRPARAVPRRLAGVLLLIAAAALAAFLNGAEAGLIPGTPLSGPVERVVDGDTLIIAGQRVRLAGLDAPESAQPCRRADGAEWACGAVATKALRALIGRSPLTCDYHRADRYGRPLVTCGLPDGRDTGAVLVADGMAVAYGAYGSEEAEAKRRGLGIWQGRFERPEAWRRDKGAAAPEGNPSRIERLIGWFAQWLGS